MNKTRAAQLNNISI